jgi:hypothetical protein
MAVDVDAVIIEPAAELVTFPLRTEIAVGAAVNSDMAVLARLKVEATERLARVTSVTTLAVRPDPAVAPQSESVHEVDSAAQESRWATTYSPAPRLDIGNVNG